MRRRWRPLLAVAAPALVLGYLGLKWILAPDLPPRLQIPNRDQKRAYRRADFKSAELCAGCHRAIYDEWRRSYMSRSHRAGTGSIGLHAISLGLRGIEPSERRWCVQCHAPLALTSPEQLDPSDPVAQEGVTCTVCHAVVDARPGIHPGDVTLDPLAGMNGPFDDARSPLHPSRRSELFLPSDSRLCGSCHWSAYPLNGLPIDWTYPEWEEYREVAIRRGEKPKSCQECHMPSSEGKAAQLEGAPKRRLASHRFPGGRDETMLRGSAELSYALERQTDGDAVLTVHVRNLAGHALPTGNAGWPQVSLSIRFLDGHAAEPIATFRYHASFRLEDGTETHDTTIAHALGPSTALRPFETRSETVRVPARLMRLRDARPWQRAVELELSYLYIRILDASAPFPSQGNRTRTLLTHAYQWLTLDETNPRHVLEVLADGSTYRRLRTMGDVRTVQPVLIRRIIAKG